ncbi:MAG: glycoside hydrolase family protein [Planctomycetota bacterium]|jgi:hypothetical protein
MKKNLLLLVAYVAIACIVSCFIGKIERFENRVEASGHKSKRSGSIAIALGDKGILKFRIRRLANNPIIKPNMDSRMGSHINGPSLILVPDWIDNPLGKYYVYFADHKGNYIRLAYANQLEGPWKTHEPGALQLEKSYFLTESPEIPKRVVKERFDKPRAPNVPSVWDDLTYPHIASPDVHVLDDKKEIRMYYHGLEKFARQVSRVAVSKDGISFTAQEGVVVNRSYLRMFSYKGEHYGMAMPGIFYRSKDGLTGFEEGPRLFNANMRHAALLVMDNYLLVFWTQAGDAPERILLSTLDISGDWHQWKESSSVEVLRPSYSWEGGELPVSASFRSSIKVPANQLRDPAIFQEDGRTFLLYAVAGESGIAIAELFLDLKSQ